MFFKVAITDLKKTVTPIAMQVTHHELFQQCGTKVLITEATVQQHITDWLQHTNFSDCMDNL